MTLQVNAQTFDIKSSDDTPLLYVLRDEASTVRALAAGWASAARAPSISATAPCDPAAFQSAP